MLPQSIAAADSCPTDSVIARDQNGTPTSKTLYTYDSIGNALCSESWKLNSDSVLIGTTKTTNEYYPNGKLKSTATWTWSSTTNDWMGTERQDYTYNTAGKTLTWSIYSWSTYTNDWMNKNKYEYAYDSANRQTLSITYIGSDTTWIPTTQMESNYDKNGNKTLERYWSSYNIQSQQWVGDHQYIYIYDNQRHQTLIEKYSWSNDEWVGSSKYTYEYNAAGERTSYITYIWDNVAKMFIISNKHRYEYDQWNNCIYSEQYNYSNNAWVGISKARAEYTGYNSNPIMQATFTWDAANSIFIGVDSVRMAYDANSNQILDERYSWSNTANTWSGVKKEQYTYNASKLLLSKTTYTWDSSVWIGKDSILADYDSHKNQTLDEQYTYDSATHAWIGITKSEYAFDASNTQTMHAYYTWDDTQATWRGTEKLEEERNAEGILIRDASYKWNATQSSWQGLQQREISYNDAGKMDTIVYSGWSGSAWYLSAKVVYTYNAAGKQTSTFQYNWDKTLQQWILYKLKGSDYNASGVLVKDSTYILIDNTWQLTQRSSKTYDANKHLILSISETWEDGVLTQGDKTENTYTNNLLTLSTTSTYANNTWVETERTTKTYDTTNRVTLEMTQEWQDATQTGGTKKTYEYTDTQTIIMSYIWSENDWLGQSRIGYTYDSAKRVTSETNYIWGTSDWQPTDKTEYEYSGTKNKVIAKYTYQSNVLVGISKSGTLYDEYEDLTTATWSWNASTQSWDCATKSGSSKYGNGKIKSQTTYAIVNNAFVYHSHTTYEFTTEGDSLNIFTYCWKDTAWADSLKQEFTYNEYGDKILYIDAKWNGTSWVNTDNSTKWEVQYFDYEEGKKIVDAHYVWNSLRNMWIGEGSRIECKFNNDGKTLETLTLSWAGRAWINVSIISKTYDNYGRTTSTTQMNWDANHGSQGDWKGIRKSESLFADDGKILMQASYTWNKAQWKWQGSNKTETNYDDNGDVIFTCSYIWDVTPSVWNWKGSLKIEYIYDENGNVIETIRYMYSNGWQNYEKVEYEYDSLGNQILYNNLVWDNDCWLLQSTSQIIYDKDENYKLRVQIDGSWTSEGQIISYKKTTYYYSCDPKLLVTVSASPTEGGIVTGGGYYPLDSQVTLTATPAEGCYTFTRWSDGDANNPRVINVNADESSNTYTAEFAPITHHIHAVARTGGSVAITIQ